jgi:hypothetical protein
VAHPVTKPAADKDMIHKKSRRVMPYFLLTAPQSSCILPPHDFM